MAAFLDPSVLLVFAGGLIVAYGIGRAIRALRARRRASPPPPMTRAERRRAQRGRK
jgi:hypothetical protein